MGATFSQFFFLPEPPITSKNCPDQHGRVFIVTGGYSGIGFELCSILYKRNATVYIAGRSDAKGFDAISNIQKTHPDSSGRLEFLLMDMSDLASVKSGAEKFLSQQEKLDVLVNNAGIMLKGSKDPQHNQKHIATNCVGPCLLYKLLLPVLTKTATSATTASVRVTWAGSIAIEVNAPKPGGMTLDDTGKPNDVDELTSYGQSKVGNAFLARRYAKDTPQNGVVHVCFNPGNLRSNLQRHWNGLDITLMKKMLFFPTVYGAYTELWATIAPEITPDKSGSYIYPWGRFGKLPAATEASLKEPSEGGTGLAARFVAWCEKQTEPYL
ncbi:NAD(P)-binding protein [Lophiostoma macrostomum CBS 122681]|uniref:NAD(P)-binding protein n=1 Tax=Lophiostoma macrostomum CBS 122681 TaxID=1314788 RepID=A0A6A6SKT6_9PLEO|nr:NAD(P)-binding protein [Lophiostoma macrostomum CBS 122681]